jgi:hypothetical protein
MAQNGISDQITLKNDLKQKSLSVSRDGQFLPTGSRFKDHLEKFNKQTCNIHLVRPILSHWSDFSVVPDPTLRAPVTACNIV